MSSVTKMQSTVRWKRGSHHAEVDGGGHMPDMEDRLVSDFKLKRDGEEWLEAWNLREKK